MADLLKAVVLTTGPLLTLGEAKSHLNVEHSDDDALIETYADAAVRSCLNQCDLKLVPQGAEAVFKVAALLVIGDLYANRETLIIGATVAVSPTAGMLLDPYRTIRI